VRRPRLDGPDRARAVRVAAVRARPEGLSGRQCRHRDRVPAGGRRLPDGGDDGPPIRARPPQRPVAVHALPRRRPPAPDRLPSCTLSTSFGATRTRTRGCSTPRSLFFGSRTMCGDTTGLDPVERSSTERRSDIITWSCTGTRPQEGQPPGRHDDRLVGPTRSRSKTARRRCGNRRTPLQRLKPMSWLFDVDRRQKQQKQQHQRRRDPRGERCSGV
jgi:hypothetical protein